MFVGILRYWLHGFLEILDYKPRGDYTSLPETNILQCTILLLTGGYAC